MRNNFLGRSVAFALLSGAIAVPTTASAAGFSLSEQSMRGLGHAYSGGAALASDASTIYFNPAGMTNLEGEEIVGGVSLIDLTADFTKDSAVDAIGQPLSGGEGGSVGELGIVPNLYWSRQLDDRMWFGLGVNAPFGLATEYDADSIFRYKAIRSDVAIININPSFAYKFNDVYSMGFGLNYQHMQVELSNAIDFGAVCFASVGPTTCTGAGLTPQNADGKVVVDGDSNAWGWNLGLLADWGHTRVGFSYRAKVDHDLEGDADFTVPDSVATTVPPIAASPRFQDQAITANFETPELMSLSILHKINDEWQITGDITRTGWDTFQELRIDFANDGVPDSVTPENWEDVMRYSVGTDWAYSDQWTFRTGVAYDESPIPDEFRTARLPSSDRTWLSFGATWHYSRNLELDFGYAHLFLDDDIFYEESGSFSTISGSYEASADIVGAQFRYLFD